MYHVMHNTCTMHGRDIKTQYIGSTSILLLRKDWNSISFDRVLSSFKKHFQLLYSKVVRMKTEEVLYEKVYMSPRPPPKISLKHEWKRELGSDHAQRAEAGQLSRSFQSNQPTLNPIRERSGRPDITHDVIGVQDERKTSRSQEIDVNSFCEEPSSSERTGRPVTGPIPGKTRSWDKCNPNTFIWRQKGFQRWTGTWANGATCWDKCEPNTFIWKQKRFQCWTDTWANGATCQHSWRD